MYIDMVQIHIQVAQQISPRCEQYFKADANIHGHAASRRSVFFFSLSPGIQDAVGHKFLSFASWRDGQERESFREGCNGCGRHSNIEGGHRILYGDYCMAKY